MSCSWKARSLLRTVCCSRLASATARSKIWVPVARVRRKASSSAYAICAMRAQSVGDLGIGLRHQIAADRQQFGQHRLSDAKQAHGADHPAQQSAQHVAAGLIARRNAVTDQHQARPDVVADHPQPYVVVVLLAVAPARPAAAAWSITG